MNSAKAPIRHFFFDMGSTCKSVSPFPMKMLLKCSERLFNNSGNYLSSYKNYPNEQALGHYLFKIIIIIIILLFSATQNTVLDFIL